MIEELHLRELGIIDEATLEFGPGLTVVTGETGAGKTMVLTGLALLLGGRADSSTVRSGATKASVEGHVTVTGPAGLVDRVLSRVEDAGGDVEVDAAKVPRLIVARSLSAQGGSKAYLGGRSVPAGVLADVGESLFAVHGQDDQQRLMSPRHQRALLDSYAGEQVRAPLDKYRQSYAALRDIEAALNRDESVERQRLQELDVLRFGIEEVNAAAPFAGEDHAIGSEIERLAHSESLREATSQAHDVLHGDDADDAADAVALIVSARRLLESVQQHDMALVALATQLGDAVAVLADVSAELATYADSIDADPARLESLQQRRADLTRLTRKYGATVDEVIEWREEAAKRLERLETAGADLDELAAKRKTLLKTLHSVADKLSGARRTAAEAFESAVLQEIKALSMPDAAFSAVVRTGPSVKVADFGPDGVDEVEFLLAAHVGAEPVGVARSASGGERSRVMLAIEVVLAGADPVATMVFDEVDAGVGGRAAVEVGRRLARLARSTQVLVVTHLPQVAAFGDQHIRVTKNHDGRVTRSSVTNLKEDERTRELARMLAGLEDSDTALAHASELLEMAQAEKTSWRTPNRPRAKKTVKIKSDI